VTRALRITGLLVATAMLTIPHVTRAEELLYVIDDGNLVFTNIPQPDARSVPGFEQAPRLATSTLPVTIYDAFIETVSREQGLSADLIKAVALVESGLNPRAVSPKGAQGLMQLMPATARHYGVQDAFDPLENLRGGSRHLRHLLDEFGGDLTLALAAYNAGSTAVRRYGGVPAFRETRDYVKKVQERIGPAAAPQVRARHAAIPHAAEIRVTRKADGTILLTN
jgi:soluble lytic murein transglycosylase-like protein